MPSYKDPISRAIWPTAGLSSAAHPRCIPPVVSQTGSRPSYPQEGALMRPDCSKASKPFPFSRRVFTAVSTHSGPRRRPAKHVPSRGPVPFGARVRSPP